jgi:putative ABC transport system permease protein
MRTTDGAANAVSNLASHPLRSSLTMLGMIFGVGAVIAMLSIGEGAERQALEMIERLGIRNILVRDLDLERDELEEARSKSLGVSPRDAVAIADGVDGVSATSRRATLDPYTVLADGVITKATVHGVDANFADLTSLEIVLGRFLDPMDLRDHAQVAIIGEGVRRDLFGGDPPLGRYLKINDVWFEVIGILRGTGSGTSVQGVSVGSVDQEIYLPVTTALRKLDLDSLEAPLDEIVVQMAPDSNLREAAHRIGLLVDRLHGGADDYELVIPDALLEQSRRTQRLFTIVMGTIAGISLLVGGIGIMNIMLATVFERTREIGIRRAVGARRRDIQVLFLMESFTISLLGGVAGIVLGWSSPRLWRCQPAGRRWSHPCRSSSRRGCPWRWA